MGMSLIVSVISIYPCTHNTSLEIVNELFMLNSVVIDNVPVINFTRMAIAAVDDDKCNITFKISVSSEVLLYLEL